MNLAQRHQARGTAVLATQSPQSERVTFLGVTVWANVNRTPEAQAPRGTQFQDATTEAGAVIDYPVNASKTPQRGSVLTGAAGDSFKVERVSNLVSCIRLFCEVTK